MIDSTFVEAMEELCKKGNGLVMQACSSFEPPETYYIMAPNGEVKKVTGPPPQERRLFTNLDSLTDWGWMGELPAAWVSIEQVRVTLSDVRHSYGSMPVGLSPQMNALIEQQRKPTAFDQKGIVMFLRVAMAGCISPAIIENFRVLKLATNSEGQQEYTHQRQNLGKTLESKITGKEAIPETLIFDIPVVADPFLPVQKKRVEVAVEADAAAGRFFLHVLPLELTKAVRSAEIEIYNLVQEAIERNKPVAVDGANQRVGHFFPVYSGKAEA